MATISSWGGDPLSFTARSLPDWLGMTDEGNGSATLVGTPSSSDSGTHSVEIRVSDGAGGATSQSFTVTVGEANGVPFFTSSPATTAYLGKPYSETVSAYDSNDDALSFSLDSGAPSWLSLSDDGNGLATLGGTPPDFTTSTTSVTVSVTDGTTTVDYTFQLDLSSGWWSGGELLGNDWIKLDWLGNFNLASADWVYHDQLGWMYVNGTSSSSVWIWLPDVGWLWTNSSCFPYLFDYTKGDWSYFYYDASATKRYLYRYSDADWSEF